jgi:hypothetical protein
VSKTLPVHPYKGKGRQGVSPGCWVSIDIYTIAIDIEEVGTTAHSHIAVVKEVGRWCAFAVAIRTRTKGNPVGKTLEAPRRGWSAGIATLTDTRSRRNRYLRGQRPEGHPIAKVAKPNSASKSTKTSPNPPIFPL